MPEQLQRHEAQAVEESTAPGEVPYHPERSETSGPGAFWGVAGGASRLAIASRAGLTPLTGMESAQRGMGLQRAIEARLPGNFGQNVAYRAGERWYRVNTFGASLAQNPNVMRVARAGQTAGDAVTKAGKFVAATSAGKAAATSAAKLGATTIGKGLARFIPGLGIGVAAIDTVVAAKVLADPKASWLKKGFASVTAAGSIVAATQIPVVSQVAGVISLFTGLGTAVAK